MEKLLTVKEAAAYLHVSEMTIRRWTNQGSLRCYRIGGKRERRFQFQDLRDCLDRWSARPTPGKDEVPLGVGGLRVADGAHLVHLGMGGTEMLEVGSSCVREGLAGGETVLLVTSRANQAMFVNSLAAKGVDVGQAAAQGRLFLSQGLDTPQAMAAYIAHTAASSPGRFRLFGDMTWAGEKGWSLDAIRQLEEMGKDSPPVPGRLCLCQYSLAVFSGQEAMMAAETHRHTLYKGALQKSPYFSGH